MANPPTPMALPHHMDADAAEEATTLMWANFLKVEIKRITGYQFGNADLLQQAFPDYSYLDHDKSSTASYQRLEYVGDAALGYLVARKHYFMYPDLTAGQLTRLRSANVDTEKLARAALTHRLHRFLRHKTPLLDEQIKQFEEEVVNYPVHSFGLIQAPKALANIVESLICAVDLDSNSRDITDQVIEKLLQPMITLDTLDTNPVTKLYEFCQKNKMLVEFKDFWKDTGVVEVFVDGESVGRAEYKGKREVAHKRAALDAYENLLAKFKLSDSIDQHME